MRREPCLHSATKTAAPGAWEKFFDQTVANQFGQAYADWHQNRANKYAEIGTLESTAQL